VHGKSFAKLLLEVALITTGVFLGLMAEQWRENREHHQLAQASLRRFRDEFVVNRKAVASVQNRHTVGLQKIQAFVRAAPADRQKLGFPFESTDPAFLEYAAWDVALATQSLTYIDSDLAHAISQTYAVQRQLDNATHTITQVMYTRAGDPDLLGFLRSMSVYFGDCTLIEPRLLSMYDDIIPRLNRALGESPAR
jgi:hypothetical protein